MSGLYDIHCHLLPGIDDGVCREEELEETLRVYHECGFSGLVFTPHLFNPYVKTNVRQIRTVWEYASKLASSMGLDVLLGSELFCGMQEVLQGIPFAGKYQLVEFPTMAPPRLWKERLQVLSHSFTPIIAHVERYQWMSVESSSFTFLKELHCLIQCNVDGIDDKRALSYLSAGVVDVIADDNHHRQGDETLPCRLMEYIQAWPEVERRMSHLFDYQE